MLIFLMNRYFILRRPTWFMWHHIIQHPASIGTGHIPIVMVGVGTTGIMDFIDITVGDIELDN